jgi:hypothetical protein
MAVKIADSYQNTLRAIGQGLETIEVEQFEIEAHKDSYVVHGYCKKLRPNEALKLGAITDARHNPQPKSASGVAGEIQRGRASSCEFSGLKFTRNDIERFELKGQAASKNDEGTPDPHRLSQTLRLAGAYLDKKESHLLRLAWRPGFVALWRKKGLRNETKDIFTPEILYDLWVRQYKKRKPGPRNQMKKTGSD